MSVFTYNDGVPSTNNDPSDDQPDMLTNTQSIKGIWGIDHYTFGVGVDIDGRHKQCSMANQTAPGIPTGSDGVYYVNNDVPMFQNTSNANNFIATYTGTPTAASTGKTYLPGGILMQWGTVSSPGGSGTVNFSTAFSAIYNVQLTIRRDVSSTTVGVYVDTAPTTALFKYIISSSGSNSLFWIAIGAE